MERIRLRLNGMDFYPRPPRGGRPWRPLLHHAERQFLSTPSARRATWKALIASLDALISIHALREEGDGCGGGKGHDAS